MDTFKEGSITIEPKIFHATVMHRRLFPKTHAFHYGVYYLYLPLPAAPVPGRLVSFHQKDLGNRDGSDPLLWVRSILKDYHANDLTKHIIVLTMPRVLGYVFNPVTFYFCLDESKKLRGVFCEVHNTFGEQHNYLCVHPDLSPIEHNDWLEAGKIFHVSPFLERKGFYRFRFDLQQEKLGVWIEYYHENGEKQLITALTGTFSPLTSSSLRRSFFRYPLVTLKAIVLIHYHALLLIIKGIRFHDHPQQLPQKTSRSEKLKNLSR